MTEISPCRLRTVLDEKTISCLHPRIRGRSPNNAVPVSWCIGCEYADRSAGEALAVATKHLMPHVIHPEILQGEDARRYAVCQTCPNFGREGAFVWCSLLDDNHSPDFNCARSKQARYTARLTRAEQSCDPWK